MASNTLPLPLRREILRIETKLRDKLRPLADNMNAHWLEFCAKQPSLRVTDIVHRVHNSLRGHGYYGRVGMKSVRYCDFVYNLYRLAWAGPLFPNAGFGDELQNAVLTWNTCDNVVIGF
jgi:hypothetical protein